MTQGKYKPINHKRKFQMNDNAFGNPPEEKKMSPLAKTGAAIAIFAVGVIGIASFSFTQDARKEIRPAPTADRAELVFKQYCLNGKQILAIEQQNGTTSHLWNVDTSGRPILCGAPPTDISPPTATKKP